MSNIYDSKTIIPIVLLFYLQLVDVFDFVRRLFKGFDRKGNHYRRNRRGHNVDKHDHFQKERVHASVDAVLRLWADRQRDAFHYRKTKGRPEFHQMINSVVDGLSVLDSPVGLDVVVIDVIDTHQRDVDSHVNQTEDGQTEICIR